MRKLWNILHSHRYGTDVYTVESDTEPELSVVVEACGIDFEGEREDEFLEILPVNVVSL